LSNGAAGSRVSGPGSTEVGYTAVDAALIHQGAVSLSMPSMAATSTAITVSPLSNRRTQRQC
jgi:hypothetical protein